MHPAEVREITVPGAWQAQLRDLRMSAGIGSFCAGSHFLREWLHDRVYLRFGAVFHHAPVWINEHHVGDREGGFLPFSFDVTKYLSDAAVGLSTRTLISLTPPATYQGFSC